MNDFLGHSSGGILEHKYREGDAKPLGAIKNRSQSPGTVFSYIDYDVFMSEATSNKPRYKLRMPFVISSRRSMMYDSEDYAIVEVIFRNQTLINDMIWGQAVDVKFCIVPLPDSTDQYRIEFFPADFQHRSIDPEDDSIIDGNIRILGDNVLEIATNKYDEDQLFDRTEIAKAQYTACKALCTYIKNIS